MRSKVKITKRGVERMKPGDELRDIEVGGFGVRCRDSGEISGFLHYRTAGNRQRWLTLGRYGDLTVERMRDMARDAKQAARKGADPMGEREQKRAEGTVAELWQRYAREVLAHNKLRTIGEKNRMWTRRIEPAIGKRKINDVTQDDVGAIVSAPLRLDKGRVVGGNAEAANLYRLLHHLFHKGLVWRLRSKELGNPLEDIDEPKVARRERLLTGGEIGALFRTLDRAAADKTEEPQIIAVIRAAMLTGARISELLMLRWENIRGDDMELHLPDTKTGHSIRPISAEALAVLRSIERMPGSAYVFRAVDAPTEPLAYNTVEKAFRRIVAAAGIKRCTLHTIRHWFSTMTANAVSNPRVGMRLTGHRSLAAYMGYVHADAAQARALADQLAGLANALAKAPGNVTELSAKRGT